MRRLALRLAARILSPLGQALAEVGGLRQAKLQWRSKMCRVLAIPWIGLLLN